VKPSRRIRTQPAVAHADQDRHRDDQQNEAERDRRLGLGLEREVDRDRHRLRSAGKVAGERDRGPKLPKRTRPAEHGARENGGPQQWQGDPGEDPPVARAKGARGFLVSVVERTETRLDGDDQERHRDEGLGHHRRGRRERDLDAEPLVEQRADQPPAAKRKR
jgi:hypothetical protein